MKYSLYNFDKNFDIKNFYNQFIIIILGLLSAIPLGLIFSTYGTWLADLGMSKELIASIAVARTPYSLKIFWSPIVDHLKIPFLNRILGHRKSWMILCSFANMFIIYSISKLSPEKNFDIMLLCIFFLGVFSATYDLAYDAYRIELIEDKYQAIAASNAVMGYRLGLLIAGAFTFYIADLYSWKYAFNIISIIFAIYIPILFFVKKTNFNSKFKNNLNTNDDLDQDLSLYSTIKNFFIKTFASFKDMLKRPYFFYIISAIILYKAGEAFLGIFINPFLLEKGYTKTDIALIVKSYGLIATILGSYAGGIVVLKIGNYKGLLFCGTFQMLSNFAFVWLNHQEVSQSNLLIAIVIENFTGGMGTSCLISFLSFLCNKQFSATQYAILSSSASFINNFAVIKADVALKLLNNNWDYYFIFTIIISLPSLLILSYLNKKIKKE